MISNPHLGTNTESGWAMGFAWGFVGPAFSSSPPLVIAPELMDAFNEGVLVGQQAAIDGLAADFACISLAAPVSTGAEAFMHGVHKFELMELGIHLAQIGKHASHFGASLFVSVFLLMIPGPPPLNPDQVFLNLAVSVREQLLSLGIESGSLIFGVGIDEAAEGCEMLVTPVFKSLDAARSAVKAQERAKWVIARWDADSASGFSIVETSSD